MSQARGHVIRGHPGVLRGKKAAVDELKDGPVSTVLVSMRRTRNDPPSPNPCTDKKAIIHDPIHR